MDSHALGVLEFDRIRSALRGHATSDLARQVIDALEPSGDAARLRLSLSQVDQARSFLDAGEPLPVRGLRDVTGLVARARHANRPLEPTELLDVTSFIQCVRELHEWLFERRLRAPGLWMLAERILDHTPLKGAIDHAIEQPGAVRDDASPRLGQLRASCRKIEERIRSIMEEIVDAPRVRPHLQERGFSVRNGRFVLPIRLEMKGHVPGILHDKSASGSTAFIEPREVVPLSNELAEARLDESREVTRILYELTRQVIDDLQRLQYSQNVAAWLDFTAARAAFSREVDGCAPSISEDGVIRLRHARHPLLVLRARAGEIDRPIEPLSLEIGRRFRMLVVTGPNTGGKTVVLKTVGLIQAMFQCGLHVPVAEGSELPIVADVFADIGDEQSLQQSLSTFSGHVRQIARVLERAGPNTVVLLDELGAGTDPVEGAALGRAILERLLVAGARTIVTTHLGVLKGFAFSHADVENAAMEFDPETFQPTYRLIVGRPGNSNALLIARKYGIPEDVAKSAEVAVLGQRDSSHELIEGLTRSREAVENARRSSEDLVADARRKLAEAENRLREAHAEKGRLEVEADASLRRVFNEFSDAARSHLNALKNVPRALVPEVEALEKLFRQRGELPTLGDRRREFLAAIKKDDQVFVPKFNQICRVKKMNRSEERLTVQYGALVAEISFDDVSFVTPPTPS